MSKKKKTSLTKALIQHSKGASPKISKKEKKSARFSQPVQKLAQSAGLTSNFDLLRYSWYRRENIDLKGTDDTNDKSHVVSSFDFEENKSTTHAKDSKTKKVSKDKPAAKPKKAKPSTISKKVEYSTIQTDFNPSAFTQWLSAKSPHSSIPIEPSPMSKNKKKKGNRKKKSKIEDELKTKIAQSISASDEIVTETLAKLYMEQGYYKKAKKAYKKLSLKYPKKSSFFAAQIKDIKKKQK